MYHDCLYSSRASPIYIKLRYYDSTSLSDPHRVRLARPATIQSCQCMLLQWPGPQWLCLDSDSLAQGAWCSPATSKSGPGQPQHCVRHGPLSLLPRPRASTKRLALGASLSVLVRRPGPRYHARQAPRASIRLPGPVLLRAAGLSVSAWASHAAQQGRPAGAGTAGQGGGQSSQAAEAAECRLGLDLKRNLQGLNFWLTCLFSHRRQQCSRVPLEFLASTKQLNPP